MAWLEMIYYHKLLSSVNIRVFNINNFEKEVRMRHNALKLIALIALLLLGSCGSQPSAAQPTNATVPAQTQGGAPTLAPTALITTATPTAAANPTARVIAIPIPTLAP